MYDRDFSLLTSRGITRAVINFSGGNDQGGADDFLFFDKNNNPVEFPHNRVYQTFEGDVIYYDKETNEARVATADEAREALEAQNVMDTLESPIYGQYGGFAGEFSVHGTVIWDLISGEHEFENVVEEDNYYDEDE